MERSLIISDGDTLTADTLPLTIQNPQDNTDSSYSGFDLDGVETVSYTHLDVYKRQNDRFVRKGLCYLRAMLSAGLLAGIAWLLSISIYYSIQYIFEIWQYGERRFMAYSSSIAFAGILPLLFLLFNREKEEEEGVNKLFDVLLNYVL